MDGVLHYSEFIKKKFNVIAIAVSGEDKEKQIISTFYIPKNQKSKRFPDKKLLTVYRTHPKTDHFVNI